MQLETILNTLQANQTELHRRGIQSLVLIDPRTALSSGHPLHFLIALNPPHTYQRLRDLTLHLTDLLNSPAELILVNPNHTAVQPYLDPDAIVVL